MNLTNPVQTIINFFKLTISRYSGLNLMGEKIEDIFNFLKLTDVIATSGQPTEKQFAIVKHADYQVVINLAPTTAENALPDERATVESLGIKYVNIPVDFNHPTPEDFASFCTALQQNTPQPTLIHCAANLRVSAFMYLYRRIYKNYSEEKASIDLHKIWHPNSTWQKFIQQVIENNSSAEISDYSISN